MTTLVKVAKRAGVSIATVSKVLSGTPYFTEETRQKVMQAVEELGYVPNLVGRALSTGKTHIIGVIFPHIYDGFFQDPFTLYVVEGVEAECNEQGYNLLFSTPRLSELGPDENYLRLIRSGYLDGVVAFDNVPTASVLNLIRQRNIPAVAIGYGGHEFSVRSDDFKGSQLLMDHVLSLGHRRIGIITVPDHIHFCAPERMIGYQSMTTDYGLNFNAFPVYYGDFSIQSGARCATQIFDNSPDVTAIICLNDRMAFGAIQEAHRRGFRVPEDITVVGYDNIPMSELFAPSLTTVDQNGPAIGRAAIRMLFELLNDETPDSVLLPPELVIRQSSARPKS